jgi:hypothetical protein
LWGEGARGVTARLYPVAARDCGDSPRKKSKIGGTPP